MDTNTLFFVVSEGQFEVNLVDSGFSDPLNRVYYLYFAVKKNKKLIDNNIIIGISDLVLDQWGKKSSDNKDLIAFCWRIFPTFVKDDMLSGAKIVFHRDDNVVRKEGTVYFKVRAGTIFDSARNMVFGDHFPTNSQIRREILRVCYSDWSLFPHGYTNKMDILNQVPADEVEIERNLKYLVDKYYLQGEPTTAGFIHVRLSDRGVDLYENPDEFNRLFSMKVEHVVNVDGDYITSVVNGSDNNIFLKSNVTDSFNEIEKEIENSNNENKKEILGVLLELKNELSVKNPDVSNIKTIMENLKSKAKWVNDKILSHPILSQMIATLLLNSPQVHSAASTAGG